jgi:hypothetical protein
METLVGLKVSYSDIGQYTILEKSERKKNSDRFILHKSEHRDMDKDKDRDMVF